MTSPNFPGRQRGLSIIELMIAMVLGLLLLAMVFQIYLSSRRTQELQAAVASRQETLRYATTMLRRDVEMAGWRGCNSRNMDYYDTLRPHTNYLYQFQWPLHGANASAGGWSPAIAGALGVVTPGTDVLTLHSVRESNMWVRDLMPDSSSVIKVAYTGSAPGVNKSGGDIAIITNCKAASIFQVTGYNDSSDSLVHNIGTDPPVGNSTKDLGEAYTLGARIMSLRTMSYFVRPSPDGTGPSLWRKVNTDPAEELVKGIENMQIQYAVDADADFVPESFVTADAVADWRTVVAVRVALLATSLDGQVAEPDPRSYQLLETSVGPFSDRRLRRVQVIDIAMRNSLP